MVLPPDEAVGLGPYSIFLIGAKEKTAIWYSASCRPQISKPQFIKDVITIVRVFLGGSLFLQWQRESPKRGHWTNLPEAREYSP